MPIFDNELLNGKMGDANKLPSAIDPILTSPTSPVEQKLDLGGSIYGSSSNKSIEGLDSNQLMALAKSQGGPQTFGSVLQSVPRSELLANKRYPQYLRGTDLEDIYGQQQSWYKQLGYGVLKGAATAVGTFAQGFASIPNTVSAIKNGNMAELSGGVDGYESQIDGWLKNLEDTLPNYVTKYEREHPYMGILPGTVGFGNFWGDKIIKNLGFTAGAIGSALAQDAIIGFATEGIGAIPLIGAQLGKAALWLNKLAVGSTDLNKTIQLARGVEVGAETFLNTKRLAEVAAYTKLTDGVRYGLNIYGSARTEAAVEARDGYRQTYDALVADYKLNHFDNEPTGDDLKEIEKYSENAMNTRFGMNMALLTISNAAQFGNLFKSFSKASTATAKGIQGGVVKELEEAGKIGLKEGSKDVFEKKVKETISGRIWESVRPKLANVFTEGVYEEGGQYATERAVTDYYTRKYKNKDLESWNTVNETLSSTMKGLKDQFGSEEGVENMIVGAISALISGGIMGKIDSVKGRGADARLNSAINILNKYGITSTIQNSYNNTVDAAGIAKDMEAAAASGDVFKYKNFKSDMFYNFVTSRLGYGMDLHDVTIEQLNMLKDLSKEEFEKTFGMDFNTANQKNVSAYVDNLIGRANEIKDTHDSINGTFKNVFTRTLDPQTPEQKEENKNWMRFEGWKDELVKSLTDVHDSKRRVNDVDKTVSDIHSGLSADMLKELTNPKDIKQLAKDYEEQANQLKKTITEYTSPRDRRATEEQIKTLRTASERIMLLGKEDVDIKTFRDILNFELNNRTGEKDQAIGDEWVKDLFDYGVDVNRLDARKQKAATAFDVLSSKEGFDKYYKSFDVVQEESTAPTNVSKETIKIKTKDGEKEITIGERYVGGAKEIDTIEGVKLNKFTEFDVLGVNEDGSIKIKTLDGKVHNLTLKAFEEYKLSKSSGLNRNARFYIDNSTKLFNYKLKGNKSIEGNIVYDKNSNTLYFESIEKKKNGKPKHRIPVNIEQFTAKEGFTQAQIWSKENFSEKTLQMLQEKASEEEKAANRDIEAKRNVRINVLTEMFDEVSEKLKKTSNLIKQKNADLERITKDLSELEDKIAKGGLTKRNNFKATTNKAIKAANRLSRMQEQLRLEIEELQTEQEQLEFNQAYIDDMVTNIDILPTDSTEFLEELNESALNLRILHEETGKQISQYTKIIKNVEDALQSAIDMISNLVSIFEKTYPKVPTVMGQEWVDFLNTNPNFLKINPNFREDLAQVEDMISQVEDLDIVPNERTVKELNDKVKQINAELKDLEKEISIKEEIVAKFEEIAKKHRLQEAEKKRLLKNEEFINAVLGTMVNDQQTLPTSDSYEVESKKDETAVVTSTIPTTDPKPHHVRANRFGNKFPTLKNKNKIKGVLVTSKNEAELIPGLIDMLAGDNESIDKTKTIALVMVNEDGKLVDENGEVIPEGVNLLDNAIYQVFPDETLEWDAKWSKDGKPKSMFRKTVSDTRQVELRKRYKEWRNEILDSPSLHKYSVTASFGILDYEKYKDENGNDQPNFRAKNSVEDANLITTDDLEDSNVIIVRTTEGAETNGSVTLNNAKGRPLLKTANGLVKLNNRTFSEKEANLLVNVISRLANNIAKDGNAKSKDSTALLNWLQSIVYWGIPKTVDGERKAAKYNSVWFEKDATTGELRLFLSGKGASIPFTPMSIEENKEMLVGLFQEMYNNVNATTVKKSWNEPYNELVGISSEGELQYRTWNNYQSYLLSNKNPDGTKRTNIPLTTIARPITTSEDVNRKSVYFTINDTIDRFLIPEDKPSATTISAPTPTVLTPVAPKQFVSPGGYTLDGTTENKMPLGKYGEVPFTLDAKTYIESDGTKGLTINFIADVVKSIMDDKNVSEDRARDIIGASIINKLKPEVEAYKAAQQPAPAAPVVSDIEADIEKRRQEDRDRPSRESIMYKLRNKIAGIDNPTPGNEIPTLSEAIKIAGAKLFSPIKINQGEITHVVFDQEESNFRFTYKGKQFAAFYIESARGITRWEITKFNDKTGTYQSVSLDELKNINEKYGSQRDLLIDLGAKDLVEDIENFEKVEYSQEDKSSSNGIIPLENAVSAEQIRLGKKYGVTYTLEDFLKEYDVELANLEETKPAEATIVTQSQQDISDKEIDAAIEDLVKNPSKTISKIDDDKGIFLTVTFAYNQKEDESHMQTVGGFEDYAEVEEVTTPKGNYFTLEDAPESFTLHENDPRLKKIVKDILAQSKEGVQETIATTSEEVTESDAEKIKRQIAEMSDDDDVAFREKVAKEIERFEGENWEKVEKWLKANFPNVPVYRVKNIIQATNGRQAWGMLKDGAIYIYENAEVGTVYHEVFEAVWKMFSDPAEQASVRNEFRSRKGSFEDRPTGRTVKYSEATDSEIKEQLAEEFRDYVLYKKIPAKPGTGRPFIMKLFSDLVNFIKEFFTGNKAQSNTEKLFEKIGNGYYKTNFPYSRQLSFAKEGVIDIDDAFADDSAEFRIAMPGKEIDDVIQHMTYLTLGDIVKNNKSLFSIPNINKTELYKKLKDQVQKTILKSNVAIQKLVDKKQFTEKQAAPLLEKANAQWKAVEDSWEEFVQKHEDYLRGFSIEFDENDNAALTDDAKSKDEGFGDSRKIDHFKKANSAIKLLLSTVARVNAENKINYSTINGVILIPTSEVYMKLMNALHTSRDIVDMLKRLRDIAKNDPNYRNLYTRITKLPYDSDSTSIDFSKLTEEHDLQLLSAFYKTFKKQNPDVKSVFILSNGDVVVGDSNLSTAARQVREDFGVQINDTIKSGKNKYIKYDDKKKAFVTDTKAVEKLSFNNVGKRIAFLKELGIEFTSKEIDNLSGNKLSQFNDAVDGIRESLSKLGDIKFLNNKTLNIEGRLLELSIIRASINSPEFDSTYFNVSGERVQSFIGTNPVSDLFDAISQVENMYDLQDTQYAYLLPGNDVFSQGSVILGKIFNLKTGERKKGADENYLKAAYADGTIDEITGKKTESSRLTYVQRLVQEINMNLSGYYSNLVPGDAAMEHMVYLGNHVSLSMLLSGMGNVNDIFKKYFIAEYNLSKDTTRNINEVKGRKSTDLRFFKSILGEKTHEQIVNEKNKTAEQVYDVYEKRINAALENYIKKNTNKLSDTLSQYGVVTEEEEGLTSPKLNLEKNWGIDKDVMDLQLQMLTINYMIANIELHKLLYSDPYQYSDELKRIKNFNSPRQALMSGPADINSTLQKVWNKGVNQNDPGYTDFTKSYFRTTTYDDVLGISQLEGYTPFESTDGSGIITMQAYRNFKIRTGEWYDNHEAQFQFDMKFEKLYKSGATKEQLEKFLKNNPKVKSTYTPLKPIVSGNKDNGKKYNDVMLDKFALYPLSFRVMYEINPTSNSIKLYDKMRKEDVDYVVFKSARKVGAETTNSAYTKEGEFNTAPFADDSMFNVPFEIISVQSEVPSKDAALVTRGSQVTKLITMDYMEAGVPVDFMEGAKDFTERYEKWISLKTEKERETNSELYKEIKNNQRFLQEITDAGYKSLLDRLGIIETENNYELPNPEKVAKLLRSELLKREVNDNISKAISGFEQGHVILEATPAYQQIRNILYSIADKEVISPKISGGMKVQIPSTFLESNNIKEIEVGDKKGFTSDALKFYTNNDGERVCEIMVGRWFDSKKSDSELLEYFNTTDEGQKILAGLAFRIPTQKQNSIDVFKIAKFLPKEFGDSVVIPMELVKKVGSDFDIDKLSIYLKNVYEDGKGNVKLVPFYGFGEEAKDKFEDLFYEVLQNKIDKAEAKKVSESNLQSLFSDISLGESSDKTRNKWVPIFKEMFEKQTENGQLKVQDIEDIFMRRLEKIGKTLEELTNFDVQKVLLDEFKDDKYKQSLENQYIESCEKLVSHPKNFKRLTSPNSADELKDLSKDIVKALGEEQFDYSSVGNMLDRTFMTKLRQAFVSGKYAIGIAAVNQTNHSLNQRQLVYIDTDKIATQDPKDRQYLGTGDIKFEKYNKIVHEGKEVATLSMIKNAERSKEHPDGQDISDIISQFIDGYVDISKGPWIMQLGATPNVASTWLFLAKIGVPIKDIAYFMNQPIIRDYLQSIDKAGYSWLFISDFVNEKLSEYSSSATEPNVIPNVTELSKMMSAEKLSSEQMASQRLILKEFLKYAKLAGQLYNVTQGSNFDTASFNDPYLVFKKLEQLKLAQNSMISSVDDLLENSFVGNLSSKIVKLRDALSTILMSDRSRVRGVMENVLRPFIGESDRDFVKISQRAVNDLFDWALQNDRNLNNMVTSILLKDGGVAKEMLDFIVSVKNNNKHELYNNVVINSLQPILSDTMEGRPNNIRLTNKENKVYDQNQIIYGFEELRDYFKSFEDKKTLYGKLIRLAALQSGLSNSRISFTSLLPYEDFKELYNKTLSKLENIPNLEDFYKLNVFERTEWTDTDIVPSRKLVKKESKMRPGYWEYRNLKFKGTTADAIETGKIPQLVKFNVNSREADSDIITFTWEKGREILTDVDRKNGITVAQKKAEMRKARDYSYINKGLFKKVYDGNTPLTNSYIIKTEEGPVLIQEYVYKMINAWGDGPRAKELYNSATKSKIDNGYIKVDKEVSDDVIVPYFVQKEETAPVSQPTNLPGSEVVNRYADADVKANPNKLYIFGDNVQRKGTGGQAQIRNNLNAMGIATKLAPSMEESAFMTDKELAKNKSIIDSDIAKIKAAEKSVVFPKDGLGTGLAKLKEKAPQTYTYLKQRLLEEFGFNNDTGEIKDVQPTFESSFTPERQKEIISNFAAKHKITEQQAIENIKKGIAEKGQEAIDKIKECY